MKAILEIRYDNKTTPDIVKIVAKIKDLLKGLRGAYKIYENQNTIEVTK